MGRVGFDPPLEEGSTPRNSNREPRCNLSEFPEAIYLEYCIENLYEVPRPTPSLLGKAGDRHTGRTVRLGVLDGPERTVAWPMRVSVASRRYPPWSKRQPTGPPPMDPTRSAAEALLPRFEEGSGVSDSKGSSMGPRTPGRLLVLASPQVPETEGCITISEI